MISKETKAKNLPKGNGRDSLKKISKIFYIVVKIARFVSLLGFVIIGILVYALRYTILNYLFMDIPETAAIDGLNFATFVEYGALAKLLLVILVVFSFIISLVCLYQVLSETEHLFKRFSQEDSVFSSENVSSLKKITKNLLFYAIFDNAPKLLLLFIDLSFMWLVNLLPIIFSLITLCLSYIFQYGNTFEIQRKKSAK